MPEFQPEDMPELAWVGAEDLPVQFGNVFSALPAENAIFLNIGSMVPPIIENEEQLAAFRFLPIKPIARIALTSGNLDDLIATLENARRAFEEFKDQEEQ